MTTNEHTTIADDVDRLLAAVPGDAPISGTRFVNDSADMLYATREIEQSIRRLGGTLYVGFQDAERLDDECDVYRELIGHDVRVAAFGVGQPDCADRVDGLRWTEVRRDRHALNNQWFLISAAHEPLAFVGYETSDATAYRQGTAGNVERTWRGFVTDERRVINHLIAELEQSVTSPPDPGQWYLAATADDDARYDATRTAALAAAERDGTGLVLYDRTTESWLTTPYPRGPWSDDDDAMSAAWRMTPERLDSLGRRYLADQVRAARRAGVAAVAHMADDTGADALLEAIDRYKPSVVFLPSHLSEPSLLDRVRGNTIAALTRDVVATVQIVDLDQSVRDG